MIILSQFYEYPASFPRDAEASMHRWIGLISSKQYALANLQQARKDINLEYKNIIAYDSDYKGEVTDRFLVKIVATGKVAEAIKEDSLANPERWLGIDIY